MLFLQNVSKYARVLAATGAILATNAVFAQHEVDDSADAGPVKISGNENAFGYSPAAMTAMMQSLGGINRYARTQAEDFVAAVAAHEKVPANFILPTPGSGPVLSMTALAYAAPGKNVVTVTPGYTQLTNLFASQGGTVKSVPLNENLAYDLKAIEAAIDKDTVIVYICNPNNPTGTVPDPEELKAFVRRIPKNVLIFADEAYLELAPGGVEKHSLAPLLNEGLNMIVSRTMSKAYGMAGLRVGYGMAKPEILTKLRPYYQGGPNLLALVGGTAAILDKEFLAENIANYAKVREMVTKELAGLGIKFAEPNGSFIFMETGIEAVEFQKLMLAEKIEVGRPFAPMTKWARVSIGTEDEMKRFLVAFKKVMTAQGKLKG